jgi:hypothetical protein
MKSSKEYCSPKNKGKNYWNQSWILPKNISTPHQQTPLFIKSYNWIVQILLLFDINGPFLVVILTPLKKNSTMDLDKDYYSSTCEDLNGLWMFKRSFMTFVGGDNDQC